MKAVEEEEKEVIEGAREEVMVELDEAVEETAAEPVAEAVELPPTMGVTMEPLGPTGVAVGTTTTEVTEAVSVTATVKLLAS